MADLKETNKPNVAVALDFTVLKTSLTAMVLKDEQGFRFLAIPTCQDEAPEVTIAELIEDIKKMAGDNTDTSEIEETLQKAAEDAAREKGGNAVDTDNIKLSLKMVYLYIDTTQGENHKIVEYAFNINVVTTGLIPKAIEKFVTVDHLGIAVWNTNREAILSKMSIVNIEKYLGIEEKKEEEKEKEKG